MITRTIRTLGLLTLAVGLFAGCASTSAEKKKDEKAEYEYVKVTGSNLRVKVKKGETYQGTVGGGSTDKMDITEGEMPQQAAGVDAAAGN
jgi:hypothetical protein